LEQLDADSTATLPAAEARKERMPLVWIPATLCVGLLIAAVYLGGRILTAHSHPSSAVQTAAPVLIRPAATPAASIVQAPPLAAPAPPQAESQPGLTESQPPVTGEEVPMIDPKAGDRYLQIGALNLEETRRFIGQLRQAKFEPHVAPGPKPELLRVLIGPFTDQDALTHTKDDLARAGIKNFVRRY
jgi:cell division septation protein DedD